MPKYRVLLQTLEVNVHEVIIESDEDLAKTELEDMALDAFFDKDLPEGKKATVLFSDDGETVEGPEVVGVNEED